MLRFLLKLSLREMKANKFQLVIFREFAERRARSLQRFCRRISRHPKLVSDCDFRDFLTMSASLPRANSTAALSGAGVKRMFKTVGDVFSRMAFHMDENDRWFEAAQQQAIFSFL